MSATHPNRHAFVNRHGSGPAQRIAMRKELDALIAEEVDALESDAKLTESLQVRPLQERVKELEAALEFYADEWNYFSDDECQELVTYYLGKGSLGKTARAALAKGKTS
jgi:hypothetical protein